VGDGEGESVSGVGGEEVDEEEEAEEPS